jgi:chloramphenicol 3-O phosphotransferase
LALTKQIDIIIVNGPSCCGKTTMTREMQALSERPFIVTGIDDFVPMFSAKYIGVDIAAQNENHNWSAPGSKRSTEGFEILIKPADAGTDGVPALSSRCGPIGWSLLTGMHQAFAAMARAGNSLIIGDAASDILLYDYCATLKGLKVYLIGVYCSLPELERREASQKSRGAGVARMQFEKVHLPGEYDFTVDSEKNSAAECARLVLDFVENNPPGAFDKLVQRYGDFKVTEFPLQTF